MQFVWGPFTLLFDSCPWFEREASHCCHCKFCRYGIFHKKWLGLWKWILDGGNFLARFFCFSMVGRHVRFIAASSLVEELWESDIRVFDELRRKYYLLSMQIQKLNIVNSILHCIYTYMHTHLYIAC